MRATFGSWMAAPVLGWALATPLAVQAQVPAPSMRAVIAPAAPSATVAVAEVLMRKSGLWEQLAAVAGHARAGVAAAMAHAGQAPSTAEAERMARAVDEAYDAGRLRASVLAAMTRGLDAGRVDTLMAWYGTPVGQRISHMEETASASQTDPDAVLQQGMTLLQGLPEARLMQLVELVQVAGSAETMTQLTVETAMAGHRGARSIYPDAPGPSEAELKAALEHQRPQMMQSYTTLAMASSAKVYETLSSEDLARYVAFLKSDVGRHFHEVTTQAFVQALVQASTDLGRRLVQARDQANI